MIQSPLKKKFQMPLSTSRGNRTSLQEHLTTSSKSPFRCYTDHVMKCTQLEQELHRVNQQRKLISLEMDDLGNQYVKKCRQLQESENMNTILQEKLQNSRHTDEITKMHQLLKQIFIKSRQKNQIILEWTNRFQQLERKLDSEQTYEALMRKQQIQNEQQKESVLEQKLQLKILQDNYRELKSDRNQINQKFIEAQVDLEKSLLKDQRIKYLENEKDHLLKELESIKSQLMNRREKQINTDKDEKQKLQSKILQQEQMNQELIKQIEILNSKKFKWKQKYQKIVNEKEFEQPIVKCEHDDLVQELNEKVQQLEMENQYLREENFEMQGKIQNLTDKMLKQQLQSTYSKEQTQQFSFQEFRYQKQESSSESDSKKIEKKQYQQQYNSQQQQQQQQSDDDDDDEDEQQQEQQQNQQEEDQQN